jgi:hypothetical protein
MATPVRDAQVRFDGGLNTVSDPLALLPSQVRKATNARLTEYGAIQKRNGSWVVSDTAGIPFTIQNGMSWTNSLGTVEWLAVANGGFYTKTATGPSWNAQTGTLSTTGRPRFAVFLNTAGQEAVFIADGGLLNVWNGAALTTNIANTQDVTFLKVHNQRLWGAGSTNFPNSIFYSKLNDGNEFANGLGGQIVVRTFGNDKIVGLASLGSSLLIFHRTGVSRLTGFGQDDTTVQPEGISSVVGTIAPDTIVETDNAVYFMSDRGFYMATESSVQRIGTTDTPDPILPKLFDLEADVVQESMAVLSRRTQEIIIYVPTVGTYVYNLTLRAWAGPWDGMWDAQSAMWESTDGTNGQTSYVIVALQDKSVLFADVPNYTTDIAAPGAFDGGDRFTMSVQLRRLYMGDDTIAKALRFGYVTALLGSGSLLKVSWQTDYQSGQSNITGAVGGTWNPALLAWGEGTVVWGVAGTRNYRVQMAKTGYYFDITLSDDLATSQTTISRWQMDGFTLGRR